MSHGKEAAVEEVVHGKAAQATNHDDDDEGSLARLENAIIDAKRLPQPSLISPRLLLRSLRPKSKSLLKKHSSLEQAGPSP
ncbi:unnamed protein product [Zymoseptoria tritici ST99CH_1A5]|uniref:Uncharacterized protein n=1 Tax=Zymoseptoria tritici ST99CH_1A5 TaxID=1276529 RepID=A0A1Y6M1P3_ZYMTR|nr:unnamed protein product [Zymoseptoria tritici ST99CH_1A5]